MATKCHVWLEMLTPLEHKIIQWERSLIYKTYFFQLQKKITTFFSTSLCEPSHPPSNQMDYFYHSSQQDDVAGDEYYMLNLLFVFHEILHNYICISALCIKGMNGIESIEINVLSSFPTSFPCVLSTGVRCLQQQSPLVCIQWTMERKSVCLYCSGGLCGFPDHQHPWRVFTPTTAIFVY